MLETRQLLAAVANMTLSVTTTSITLASTDFYDPTVSVVRSGTNLIVTAGANTQLTYNGVVKQSQTINLGSTVRNMTINLGSGIDTVSISGVDATNNIIKDVNVNFGSGLGTVDIVGLSHTGNLNVSGQATGQAILSVSAASPDANHPTVGNTVIGGSINANFGSSEATFNLFGSKNGGGNLTVTGSVAVNANGSGTKQVNLAGPLANNPTGGKLSIGGNLTVTDQGSGVSGLLIDDGVTITGNVKFDNSLNKTSANTVEIYSNSQAYGVTTIGGTVTLNLSSAAYEGSNVVFQGFGTPLTFTGAVNVTGGAGADTFNLANTLFKGTLALNAGTSLSYENDLITIDGSTFNVGVSVTSSGARAELDVGTDSTYAPTVFKSTLSAFMTGPSSLVVMSNPTSTVNQVVFNSTAAFTGGNPVGYLKSQGLWSIGSGKLTLSNFTRTAPTAVKANVQMTLASGMITLTSTDILNPTFTITRSGSHVVVTGDANTLITYNGVAKASQSVFQQTLAGLTINLGTGINTVTVSGISITGALTINGKATGLATITVNATPATATIGSINANLSGTSTTMNVYGSTNNGGNLTINGSVAVTESSGGAKQINFAGPLANNPAGGKLAIKGGISVTDTGMGASGLHIDDGVTITGNVFFDNSANTVNGSKVEVFSNSTVYGVSSIGGTLTTKLAKAGYSGNELTLVGYGTTPLTITGITTITSGGGADTITIGNTLFKNKVSVDTGISPTYENDYVKIDGSTFTLATTLASSGYYAVYDIGTDPSYLPTVFANTFAAYMSGPLAAIYISNPTSASAQVYFNSTITLVGGTPAGTMYIKGLWSANTSRITKTNFTIA